MHQRARAEAEGDRGEGSDHLCSPATAHFLGHAAGENDADCLHKCREETETREGSTEEQESQAAKKRRHRRIRDVAPGEVAGVFKGGELVAVEAVAIAREQMNDKSRRTDAAQQREGNLVAFSGLRQAVESPKRRERIAESGRR